MNDTADGEHLEIDTLELLQDLLGQAIRAGQFRLMTAAPDGDGGDELTGNSYGDPSWTTWIAEPDDENPEINILVDARAFRALLGHQQ